MKAIIYIIIALIVMTTYVDMSSKVIGSREGSMMLKFDVVDQVVYGVASYIFHEQGWNIKLPGTISGWLSNDQLTMKTDTISMKYEGVSHTMHIRANAKKVGDTYIGEKIIIVDGQEHVLPFNAKNVG